MFEWALNAELNCTMQIRVYMLPYTEIYQSMSFMLYAELHTDIRVQYV